ncbi:uncharacterized protein [Halyomorpha halys]|uniref:uncharacterized protein n=1 Tax=Halyomorpha halys TaxID=286706 RepID=UPI0034D25B86
MTTHHLFVDFKSAYDSIKRSMLYEALYGLGIPPKLVRLIGITLDEVKYSVRIQGDLLPEFEPRSGVRQGDGLACLLFNLALEKVIRDSGIQISGTIIDRPVQVLGFADDLSYIS